VLPEQLFKAEKAKPRKDLKRMAVKKRYTNKKHLKKDMEYIYSI